MTDSTEVGVDFGADFQSRLSTAISDCVSSALVMMVVVGRLIRHWHLDHWLSRWWHCRLKFGRSFDSLQHQGCRAVWVCPLSRPKCLSSIMSSPSGSRGGAPAEIKGDVSSKKSLNIYTLIQIVKFLHF